MADDFPFTERYKPTTLSRIVGHRDAIAKIEQWLSSYDAVKQFLFQNGLLKKSNKGRKKKIDNITDEEAEYRKTFGNLIISGPNGCGKTSIINLIFKKLKYEPINLNKIEHSAGEIDANVIFKIPQHSENGKKHVIIVDDYDSIISTQSKSAITNMIKDNNYLRTMPIIIITNDIHNKNANDIEKYANKLILYTPHVIEITKWVNMICYENSMKLELDIVQRFVEYFEKDMRKILTQLWELYLIYRTELITTELYEKFISTMKHSIQNISLYKTTEKILSRGFDMKFCLEKYEVEKTLLPLMIYQNYPKFINNEHHHEIIERQSIGDNFEYYIHCEQTYDLTEINGIINCALPSYYANLYGNGNTNQELKFAMDFNKTSFKMKNKKKILAQNTVVDKNATSYLRNKTIDEFIYLNDIDN